MIMMIMVALIGAARLSRAGVLGGVGVPTEPTCQDLCQQQPSPVEPCKGFARALPRPKMGRTCAEKFGEGWAFGCPLVCSRITNGEDGHAHAWLERLIQSSCQKVSGHIPYPAVFNSCKTGYRSGFTAATVAVSKHFKQRKRPDEVKEPQSYPGGDMVHPQLEHEDGTDKKTSIKVSNTAADAGALALISESGKSPREDGGAWLETLNTAPEYVDYASVAKERVSASRRTRGSETKRGPACPVCSG